MRPAVNTHEAEALSTTNMESYVVARKHIAATGLPVHVCAAKFRGDQAETCNASFEHGALTIAAIDDVV